MSALPSTSPAGEVPAQDRAQQALDAVCAALRPAPVGDSSFVGAPVPVQWGVPFGGLLVAQALAAAAATTAPGMWPRSLHSYFLAVGRDDEPVDLAVSQVAGSRSTSWHTVDVSQGGRLLLHAETMFSLDRAGPGHTTARPQAPAPDELANVGSELAGYDDAFTPWGDDSAFDLRYITPPPRVSALDGPGEATSQVWIRAAGEAPRDRHLAAALLAYASDMCMLDACLRPSGLWFGEGSAGGLTLDHSMWFHAPARVDDWLLLDLRSPAMRQGRGLGTAELFARDGELLCSVAQLGSVRPHPV